jgi:uncharacterized membrane protein
MKKLLPLVFVICLSLFAVRPLWTDGYFPMHDDTQVSRVIAMGRSLKEGQFPVRWVSDLGYGYGYPIFNFYGPLPYYAGGALYALGLPALLATKIMFSMGILLSAIFLYGVLVSIVGWQAAVLGSLLYMFAPYHAAQVYVRGAVGEYWILMFWPLIMYGFWGLSHPRQRFIRIIIGSMGLGGAILSHTLLGYVTVLFCVAGVVFYWGYRALTRQFDKSIAFFQLALIFLGLGISSFFWLPAVVEMGYTSVAGQVSATADYRDHFVCFGQLWSSLWGFGGSAPGCLDGMSFVLGKLHLLLAVTGVVAWFMGIREKGKHIGSVGLALFIISVFFMTEISQVVWSYVPGFAYLQYPWRFLAVASLGLSLLGSLSVETAKKPAIKTVLTLLCVLVLMLGNVKWFFPQYTYEKDSEAFETASDLRWRVSKISDEYLPPGIVRPTEESEAIFDTIRVQDGLTVTSITDTATHMRLTVETTASASIVVNTAYFPGWKYAVNNRDVLPEIQNGLPVLSILAGTSVIDARFTDTPVRIFANIITAITLVILGGIYYDGKRKAKR